MAKANLLDPKVRAAKKRKQAIVLGVVFVAVLAISVPQTMKMMNQSAPTSKSASEPTGATGATATPGAAAAGGSAQAIAATSGEPQVVAADLAPAPLDGQLVEFDAFEAKDPFVQQAVATTGFKSAGSSGAANSAVAAEKNGSRGVVENENSGRTSVSPAELPPSPSPSEPSSPSTAPATSTPATPAQLTSATISVNGVQESVNVGSDFPVAAPLFRLRKVTTKTADISIAGGTLASGAPTVTLKLGKPLTLMNTADGTRYVLILVATGTAPSTGSTTPTTP